jgi:23S rRNA pseudouridine1911/1915/1917 synthase
MRVDAYLAHELAPEISRSQIARAIKAGLVMINDRTAHASDQVSMGDRIELRLPEPAPPAPPTAAAPSIEVLWEDADLIFVNKPAGMAVHPSPGHPDSTLVDALMARFPDLAAVMELDGTWRAGIVHRLDKDTSGVMVVARNAFARAALSEQFRQRTVVKIYIAIVAGHPSQYQMTIDRPIGRHQIERKRMSIHAKNGREAQSEVRILKRCHLAAAQGPALPISIAAVHPRTGRTHQIRVHLASIGHPCLGDPVYGRQDRQRMPIKRQALHAFYLALSHPRRSECIAVIAPVAPDLSQMLADCGLDVEALAATAIQAQGIEAAGVEEWRGGGGRGRLTD